jgi:hypothetical protein
LAETLSDEKKVLDDRLGKALDEAWSKANLALEGQEEQSDGFEPKVRLAAEATEYSSALFSLAYGLEDFDPEVNIEKKNIDSKALMKQSVEELRKAMELRKSSTTEAYSSLRAAADHLKIAYLDHVKKSAKK